MKKKIEKQQCSIILEALFSRKIISGLGLGVVGAIAMSNVIAKETVEVSETILNIHVASAPSSIEIFNMENTNIVVLDIFGVDRIIDSSKISNDPIVKKISKRLVDGRARIIIETYSPVLYNATIEGSEVITYLKKSDRFEKKVIKDFTKINKQVVREMESTEKPDTWSETNTRASSLSDAERLAIIEKVKRDNNESMSDNHQYKIVNGYKEEIVQITPISTVVQVEPVLNKSSIVEKEFLELTKINIKKETSKSTKIVFDISSKSIEPIIKKVDDKLIIELNDVSIPLELQRRLNTDSIGTALKVIDISTQKNQGRIMLETKGVWDYSFYQTDKQFAVTIKEVDEKEDLKKYTGKPLTISFQDIDVRAVLQVIADFTNLNIMTSDNVSGSMTLRLKDVPWDQALDLILDSRGLQKIKEGNVIRIATNDEVEKSNESKLKLKNQSEALEKLKLEFFQVNFYKAEELKDVLEGGGTKSNNSSSSGKARESINLLSSRGSIGVDNRNNILMVQDTEDNLNYIRNIIKKLDVPTRQVLIEAKIVLAEDSFGKELGSKFGIRARKTNGNNSIGIGGNLVESGNIAAGTTDSTTTVSSLPAAIINGFNPGVIGFTLLNLGNGNALGFELSALENSNRGKVLSSPRLLTTDNKKAVIEQGTEIPYVTPGAANAPPTVAFKKAVLKLDVTPQITPNGRVIMDLEIRKDSIGQLVNVQGGGQVPSIDTRNLKNQITVMNGQTVVLGGVYEVTNRDDIAKIPFFGDIPGLGNLFKHKAKSEEKGELLIFITPHVIEDEDLEIGFNNEINLQKR
jgi:type IV pilus assembly protein PilQ